MNTALLHVTAPERLVKRQRTYGDASKTFTTVAALTGFAALTADDGAWRPILVALTVTVVLVAAVLAVLARLVGRTLRPWHVTVGRYRYEVDQAATTWLRLDPSARDQSLPLMDAIYRLAEGSRGDDPRAEARRAINDRVEALTDLLAAEQRLRLRLADRSDIDAADVLRQAIDNAGGDL